MTEVVFVKANLQVYKLDLSASLIILIHILLTTLDTSSGVRTPWNLRLTSTRMMSLF